MKKILYLLLSLQAYLCNDLLNKNETVINTTEVQNDSETDSEPDVVKVGNTKSDILNITTHEHLLSEKQKTISDSKEIISEENLENITEQNEEVEYYPKTNLAKTSNKNNYTEKEKKDFVNNAISSIKDLLKAAKQVKQEQQESAFRSRRFKSKRSHDKSRAVGLFASSHTAFIESLTLSFVLRILN